MYQDYRADRRPRDYSGEDVRFEGAERPADHEHRGQLTTGRARAELRDPSAVRGLADAHAVFLQVRSCCVIPVDQPVVLVVLFSVRVALISGI